MGVVSPRMAMPISTEHEDSLNGLLLIWDWYHFHNYHISTQSNTYGRFWTNVLNNAFYHHHTIIKIPVEGISFTKTLFLKFVTHVYIQRLCSQRNYVLCSISFMMKKTFWATVQNMRAKLVRYKGTGLTIDILWFTSLGGGGFNFSGHTPPICLNWIKKCCCSSSSVTIVHCTITFLSGVWM